MRSEIWVDIKESFTDMSESIEASSKSFCRNCEGDDPQKQLPTIKQRVQDSVFAHLRKRVNELIEANNEKNEFGHRSYAGFWRISFMESCRPTMSDPLGEYIFRVDIEHSRTDQYPWKKQQI